MLTRLSRWLFLIICLGTLLYYGGAGDQARTWFGITIGIIGCLVAIGMKSQARLPDLRWIAVLFVPLIILLIVQVFPFGWHHPWVTEDVNALQSTMTQWSIDPATSYDALFWTLILCAAAVISTVLWRGDRLTWLANGLVVVAAFSAALGLLCALLGVPWPAVESPHRARGPFIYPNHAAAFWTACLPLALLLAHKRTHLPFIKRWSYVAVLALAILLSTSRGGILVAACIMIPLVWHILPKKGRLRWCVGIGGGITTWLWLIGIQDVVARFDQLRTTDGITLSGRLIIWEHAWPIITSAGLIGSGAGTTTVAYRRSEDTHFSYNIVDHLHNDPLEWCLEYGLLGGCLLLIIVVFLCWRARPSTTMSSENKVLHRGAFFGLCALSLHACGDFIWHNTAIAIVGILLLVLVMSAKANATGQTAQRTLFVRLFLFIWSVIIFACAWPSYQHVHGVLLARDAERQIAARSFAKLPVTSGEALTSLRDLPPNGIRLANVQAWLARTEGRYDDAKHILTEAAALSPGDAATWIERAYLAAALNDQPGMQTAINRALHWAPVWPSTQNTALQLTMGYGQAALPEEDAKRIITTLLQLNRSQPAWFFYLSEQILGTDAVSNYLKNAQLLLAQSGERWLAEKADLPTWIAIRKKHATKQTISPWMLPVAETLYNAHDYEFTLPISADQRRQLAEHLQQAAMPMPDKLIQALQNDSKLHAFWAKPVDILDSDTQQQLDTLLRSELHRAWVKNWSDRLIAIKRAQAGDTNGIGRDTYPEIIAWIAGVIPEHPIPPSVIAAEQQRILLLLERWREWDWQTVDATTQWSWHYNDGTKPAIITTNTWAAVIINGTPQGWIRGTQDISPLIPPGLNRIVLITPN